MSFDLEDAGADAVYEDGFGDELGLLDWVGRVEGGGRDGRDRREGMYL